MLQTRRLNAKLVPTGAFRFVTARGNGDSEPFPSGGSDGHDHRRATLGRFVVSGGFIARLADARYLFDTHMTRVLQALSLPRDLLSAAADSRIFGSSRDGYRNLAFRQADTNGQHRVGCVRQCACRS